MKFVEALWFVRVLFNVSWRVAAVKLAQARQGGLHLDEGRELVKKGRTYEVV